MRACATGVVCSGSIRIGTDARGRAWLDDPGLRERLGRAAAGRRPALRRWAETVDDLAAVLDRVASHPLRGSGVSR